jgi:hypothetical protein
MEQERSEKGGNEQFVIDFVFTPVCEGSDA